MDGGNASRIATTQTSRLLSRVIISDGLDFINAVTEVDCKLIDLFVVAVELLSRKLVLLGKILSWGFIKHITH